MQFRQLMHFLAVVEEGTFAAAARSLDLSQQALSASIGKLEDGFDVKLFDRTSGTGAARLTVFGDAFLRHAQRIRTEAARAETEIHLLREAASGEVRIGVGIALSGRLAPRALQQFRRLHPNVRLVVEEGPTHAMFERLLAGELDLVAGAMPVDTDLGSSLSFIPLGEGLDRVVARATHPLAGRSKLRLRDLVPFPWIIEPRAGGEREVIAEAFIKAGLEPPEDVIWSNGVTTGRALLLSDDYLSLSPPDLNIMMIEAGLLTVLDIDQPTRIRTWLLSHRREHPLSPAAQALAAQFQLAREYFG